MIDDFDPAILFEEEYAKDDAKKQQDVEGLFASFEKEAKIKQDSVLVPKTEDLPVTSKAIAEQMKPAQNCRSASSGTKRPRTRQS